MPKQITLRACLCLVLLISATTPGFCQTDTTTPPTKLGFFAGPVISNGPTHAVIGITLANDHPISLALWIDPADTTVTITTSSAIRMATFEGWSLHTLIGGSLQMIDRELTYDEQVTYLLLTSGIAVKKLLFDSTNLILAANWSAGQAHNIPMRLTIALHFEIGAKPHRQSN